VIEGNPFGALRFWLGDRLAGVPRGKAFALRFGSLGVDVGTHRLQGCTADTADEVSPVPEQRLLVERRNVFSKAVARSSGVGRLDWAVAR